MDTISRIYTEVWFYVVVFGGFVQGSFVGAFGVITLLATPTRFRSRIWRGFLKFLNFNVVLLIVGAFACGLWAFVAYPRWYIYADPVVSYQPVIPFGQW